jgi:hypothetical protein
MPRLEEYSDVMPTLPRMRLAHVESVLLLALLGAVLVLAALAYRPVRTAAFAMDAPPVFLPLHGFHAPEYFLGPDHPARWTQASSVAALPNPGGRAVLQMQLAGGEGRTVPLRLRAGGAQVSFEVRPDLRQYRVLLPMPPTPRVDIIFEAPTIEAQGRTLGLVVSRLGVSGGGGVPGGVLAALALATLSGYALLRQAGAGPLRAALLVLLALGLLLLWQAAGGWRYALLVPLLLLVSAASLGAVVLERWPGRLPPPERAPLMGPLAGNLWPLGAVLLLALALRLPWLTMPDPVGDLELAARRMGFLFEQGLAGAYVYDGDYMPLRLYLLAGLSQLVLPLGGGFHAPLPPATLLLIKLPGLLADLLTIGILYAWSLRWLAPWRAAALAALYAAAPPVWINVAWWGQVDALLMLPLLGVVLLLDRQGGRLSWLCWVVALLIKPQAIVLAPLLYIATVRRHGSRGVAQGGALALGGFALACVPLVLAGQGPGLMQAYLGSVGRFPKLTAGAYNLWYLVTWGASGDDVGQGIGGLSYRMLGVLLVGGVALLVGVALLRRPDAPLRAEGAAVLALAFFALPTQIHERYLFLTLAFLALRSASSAGLLLPFGLLAISGTLNIFGHLDGFVPAATAAIDGSPLPLLLAALNIGLLVVLIGHLLVSSRTAASVPAAGPPTRTASTSSAPVLRGRESK